ncbi:MAG: pilus assembly protein PilW [Lysobacteraceae bacterium]|nr:MAG: pilus assembly protein PilW [Xanthomonadaceae bacterium]
MSLNMNNRGRGFSLVELMVAMIISALLLLGLVQIFGASSAAYRSNMGVARTQEGSRFAMDFLSRDLRMAGYMGCVNDMSRFMGAQPSFFSHFMTTAQRNALNYNAAEFGLRFNVAIQGYEATGTATGAVVDLGALAGPWAGTPAFPAVLTPVPRAGSDIVVLRFFGSDGALVTGFNPTPGSGAPTISIEPARAGLVTAGGLYALGDCNIASVFQATTAANPTTGTFNVATSGLNRSGFQGQEALFGLASMNLYRAESLIYYVAEGPGGIPSLYRATATGAGWNSEEIVEGVEMLQLAYGVDTAAGQPDGAINEYRVASAITTDANWRRVGAVRIGMLMRSPDRAATADRISNQFVNGVRVTAPANSGVLRVSYENTVTLRNRLFGN